MRKLFLGAFLMLFLLGCNKDKFNNKNPFIPNIGFSTVVNLSLPYYSELQFAGTAKRINDPSAGVRGVILFNTGSGFMAYDGACPNQALAACSTLNLNGISAVCPCDNAQYSLYTGQCAGKEYPLKPYRVEVNGNLITVYN